MEKELTELTIEELKELAEKESIEIKEEEKEKIIEEIEKARELKAKSPAESEQETEKTSNEKENKGKGKGKGKKTEDSIDKEQKKVEVPEGFTKKTNLNKKEYGYYKGRKYKKLKNGYGMWADTGTAFVIKDLK